jgi:hypothetical protein
LPIVTVFVAFRKERLCLLPFACLGIFPSVPAKMWGRLLHPSSFFRLRGPEHQGSVALNVSCFAIDPLDIDRAAYEEMYF